MCFSYYKVYLKVINRPLMKTWVQNSPTDCSHPWKTVCQCSPNPSSWFLSRTLVNLVITFIFKLNKCGHPQQHWVISRWWELQLEVRHQMTERKIAKIPAVYWVSEVTWHFLLHDSSLSKVFGTPQATNCFGAPCNRFSEPVSEERNPLLHVMVWNLP